AVEKNSFPLNRVKELVGNRIEDHSEDRLATLLQGNRDREGRHVVNVIRGPVKRIHNPAILRFAARLRGCRERGIFLTQKIVTREATQQNVPNGLLGGDIGFSDEVPEPLFLRREAVLPVEQNLTPGSRRLFA